MVELEFDYNQNKVFMQVNYNDNFSTVINKYYQKAQVEPNSVVFFAHSIQIPENKRVFEIMNSEEKRKNKMYIAVFTLYFNKEKKNDRRCKRNTLSKMFRTMSNKNRRLYC